jgi:hypothetical protein
MTIANVSLTNTFDEWRIKTNQLIGVYQETNTLAIAAYDSTNTVTFTAANLAANVLVSNTIILTAITNTVNTAVPIVMTTNTQIITLITDSANTTANNINYAEVILSNSAIIDQINFTTTTIVTNTISSNATILTLISDSANVVASNVDYASIILANSSIMNEINLAASAAASNAITSNTIVIDTVYTNANNIVYDFINSTDVGASFVQANTAYLVANAAFAQSNLVFGVANSSFAQSNLVFGVANSSFAQSNLVFGVANAAFEKANTSSGSTITLNDDTVDETRYIGFVNAISGNASTINVSSTKLTFNPNTGILSATIFNSLSDSSLKDNVIRIGGALVTINSLEGVSFQWKNNGMRSYGVIAQDLEKHIPDLVGNVNGTKNVNYDGIIAFLIEAIKELSRKLDAK